MAKFLGSTRGVLLMYVVALALIAFWPEPVDRGARSFLSDLERLVPVLSYTRVEFLANIALFVPLGLLATKLLPNHRYLVMPVGFLASSVIEGVQALALPDRTPSLYDILANTIGACLGLLLAVLWEQRPTPQH